MKLPAAPYRPLGSRRRPDYGMTRWQKIGMNFEESEDGVAAMAVSVGTVGGQHAALSIAMPVGRHITGQQ